MKRLIILTLGWGVSATVFALPQLPPVVIKDIRWVSNNTVRVGNAINAPYHIITQGNGTIEEWIRVDCETDQKTLLFASMFTSGPNRPTLRVYGKGSLNRYASGIPFEPEIDSPYSANPALNVCQQKIPVSKWVAVAKPDKQGNQRFIDVNNSVREGNRLSVRIATDYARVYREEKYLAPYSVKIVDKVFDCMRDQGQTLNTFLLDSQGRVTDSRSEEHPLFTALSAEETTLAKKLCVIKDIRQFSSKETLEWREKPMANNVLLRPDFMQNDPIPLQRYPLPASVVDSVTQAVITPQQRPTFNHLSYKKKLPGEDLVSFDVHIDRLPDGTLLTLDKIVVDNVALYSQYVRLFNIVDIKKWDSLTDKPVISNTLESTFVLPPVAGAEYCWKNTQSDNKSARLLCRADNEWRSAKVINPRFSGRYLEFTCTGDQGDGQSMSSDYAYIEDLRVFIRIGYHSADEKKRFVFDDVTIVN